MININFVNISKTISRIIDGLILLIVQSTQVSWTVSLEMVRMHTNAL